MRFRFPHSPGREAERAEAELDSFINKRSKAKEKVNAEEEAWKESTRRVRAKRREENRLAWIDYYGRMHHAHLGIAEDHARRRAQLLAEREYEPDEGEGVAAMVEALTEGGGEVAS